MNNIMAKGLLKNVTLTTTLSGVKVAKGRLKIKPEPRNCCNIPLLNFLFKPKKRVKKVPIKFWGKLAERAKELEGKHIIIEGRVTAYNQKVEVFTTNAVKTKK
jgi:hypothetical protein